MSHFDEDLSEQEFQELLTRVREMLREQGMSEEEIAEGVAGLRERLPQLRGMLAKVITKVGHLADGPPQPDDSVE